MASVALGVKKALAFISARVPSEELRINNLHRSEPQWAEALGAYLSSGGYARQVDQSLIRNVAQPSLVVWGSEDPILPVADAYQFEKDLQQCVGVREVAGCGHTPQLEDPDSTALHVAVRHRAGRRSAVNAHSGVLCTPEAALFLSICTLTEHCNAVEVDWHEWACG